jgi:hypothetical protein
MKESKNHHYNPRSILRRFTNSKGSIHILNKETNKTFTNSIENTGSENYFNTIRVDEESINFENIFDELDGKLAAITTKIVENHSLKKLSNDELSDLALIVATQLIRTKIVRTEAQDLTRKINKFSKQTAELLNANADLKPELNDEQIKIITIAYLTQIQEIQNSLLSKDIVLSDCSKCQIKFITSDNPVVLGTSLDYGQVGINEKGVEIFYPISPNFCISYYCSSIRNGFELVKGQNEFIDNLLAIIETRGNCIYNEKNVNQLNHMQLINSSQFVYSASDEFYHEQNFLIENPSFGKINSRRGELTNEQPIIESLPIGEFLVIHTISKSFKISIYDVENKIDFEFTTGEVGKFHLFTKDDKIKRIIYYKDKQQKAMMNEVKLLKIVNNRIAIGLENKSLAEAIQSIKNKKKD